MKKLITILLVLISVGAAAQYIPNSSAYQWKGGEFLKSLQVPTGCGFPVTSINAPDSNSAALYFDKCTGKWYGFNPTPKKWFRIDSTGNGVVSFARNTTKDSIILTLSNGTRYAVKDSIGTGGGGGDSNPYVISYAKNVGGDSTILIMSDGTRYAAEDNTQIFSPQPLTPGWGIKMIGGDYYDTYNQRTLIVDSNAITTLVSNPPVVVIDTNGTRWAAVGIIYDDFTGDDGPNYLIWNHVSGTDYLGHEKQIVHFVGGVPDYDTATIGDLITVAPDEDSLTSIYQLRDTGWQLIKQYVSQNGDYVAVNLTIGTLNNKPFFIRTNNVNRFKIAWNGDVFLYRYRGTYSNNYLKIDSATGKIAVDSFSLAGFVEDVFVRNDSIYKTKAGEDIFVAKLTTGSGGSFNFDSAFATKTTDNLTQGSTNKYNQTHTGDATGATALTVVGIRGNAIPSLSTGFLKYNGSAWTFDNSTYLTGNQSITLSGDVGGTGSTAITTTIANNAVTNAKIANSTIDATTKLNATGTPSSSTYLRGDNTWAAVTSASPNSNRYVPISTGTAFINSVIYQDSSSRLGVNKAGITGVSAYPSGSIISFFPNTLSGTISKTSGSPTVTGSSTNFKTDYKQGDQIVFGDGETKTVQYITSNTSLTLNTNASTTASGLSHYDSTAKTWGTIINNNGEIGISNGLSIGGYSYIRMPYTSVYIGGNSTGSGATVLNAGNVGIGANVLTSTAQEGTAVGSSALSVATGNSNNAFGSSALTGNTSGASNVGIGNFAASSNTTGSQGVAIGVFAAANATSLSLNTLAGYQAARYRADGTTYSSTIAQSIYLGGNTKTSASSITNAIAIGYNVTDNGSNTVTIGNSSNTQNFLTGAVNINTTTTSASAALKVESTTQGALIPRMTKTQRNAIASPAAGLMVIVTGESGGEYLSWYNSSTPGWVKVTSTAD